MGSNRVSLAAAPVILAVVLVAAIQSANAATYKVGDTSGWTSGHDYSTWGSDKTFYVGDILEFDFSTGAHDVAQVSKDDYGNCVKTSPIASYTTGPAKVTLTSTGRSYFLCTVNLHCEGGQKVSVEVSTPSSTTPSPGSPPTGDTPASSPPPPASKTPATTSAPPPPSSASSLTAAAATSVVFGLVYMVLA